MMVATPIALIAILAFPPPVDYSIQHGITLGVLWELGSRDDAGRPRLVEELANQGLWSLVVLRANFDSLPHMSPEYYRRLVVPKLPRAEASEILLGDASLIEKHEATPDEAFGYGSLTRIAHGGYLCMTLGIDYGGAGYLFRLIEGKWIPICYLGAWIE